MYKDKYCDLMRVAKELVMVAKRRYTCELPSAGSGHHRGYADAANTQPFVSFPSLSAADTAFDLKPAHYGYSPSIVHLLNIECRENDSQEPHSHRHE